MKILIRFVKELKRVKWPTGKESGKSFLTSTTFIICSSVIFFALAIVLAMVWQKIGIGV